MSQTTRACDRCGADISSLHHNARRCPGCPKRLVQGTLPDLICPICDIPFTPPRRDSICCSRPCTQLRLNRIYGAAKKADVADLHCPGCEQTFTPHRTDQRYCTLDCGARDRARRAYKAADLSPRPCTRCGKTFTPKQSTSTLCSRLCSRRTSYQRYRTQRVASAVAWARNNPALRAAIAMQNKARRRGWITDHPDSVGVTSRDWIKLVRRYRNRCAYCGGNTGGIHMEHVIPISRGGRHAIGNVLPACRTCNLSKGAKLLTEWRR